MTHGGAESAIDVLMPVRGRLPHIEAALHSLAAQSVPCRMCYLIDDGIEERSRVAELARGLFGDRAVVLDNPGNGISAALNEGIHASSSPWIARMDADDIAHPTRFERQLDWLRSQSRDTVACGTQVWSVDERGRRLQKSAYPVTDQAIRAEWLSRTCFAHPTLMARRELLLEVQYRSPLDGAEDVDLMLRLGQRGRVGNVDEPLLDYRIHAGQAAMAYRSRQTALQELAFRLAVQRGLAGRDPLDAAPQLAEAFVSWRLADAGYVSARQALTATRYLLTYLRGGSLGGATTCLRQVLAAHPWQRQARRWVWRLARSTPGDLRHDELPPALQVLFAG